MITAVDTNVLLDTFIPDPEFGPPSLEALQRCLRDGLLVGCDVVWAEVMAGFPEPRAAMPAMDRLGVVFSPTDRAVAEAAGLAWTSYRRRGGPRERPIADFLIGAHAQVRADRLLTRDRGFYRTYFAELEIVDPTRP